MIFNICLIQPDGYVHSAAFLELAELVGYGLQDIGMTVAVTRNHIDPDATNVLIGCHLLDPRRAASVPTSTVVLNTEQIDEKADTRVQATVRQWVSRFETWDYSGRNIDRIAALTGRQAKLLQLGYHPKLSRIPRSPIQDIDVLFYGSRNERRNRILRALEADGVRVAAVFGVYGDQRDALIARAKLVLNMHYYDAKVFEIVRVFYLMSNSKAVVCEVGPDTAFDERYRGGLEVAPYEALVERCRMLLDGEQERAALEERALTTIQAMPQGPIMAELVQGARQ